jgi:ribose/xylose/arabinose/galactoside ABC-type transport system permease subunit
LTGLQLSLNRIGPLLGLAIVLLIFVALIGPRFLELANLELIARQTAIVGIAALGMTLVIIAGGIDLSAGSVVALSTVVIALLLRAGIDPVMAAGGGVLSGLVCGGLSGLIVIRLRVVPFIVTLGMMLLVRGAAKGLADERRLEAPYTGLNRLLQALVPEESWMLLPPGVWIFVVLAVVIAVMLRYTRFGRHVFAVGSNERTARLCGVHVTRVKWLVYILCAGCAGLAGVMQFSRLSVGDPTVAIGLELDIIAAVVIGGGSLAGGQGSVLGTLVGALIMTVIQIGSAQLGLHTWVQQIVTGGVIVLAVTLDHWRRKSQS